MFALQVSGAALQHAHAGTKQCGCVAVGGQRRRQRRVEGVQGVRRMRATTACAVKANSGAQALQTTTMLPRLRAALPPRCWGGTGPKEPQQFGGGGQACLAAVSRELEHTEIKKRMRSSMTLLALLAARCHFACP